MADPFLRLLVLSFFIALSSFVAGIAPLSFPLSTRSLRYLTALGSGLLVGTALSVLIPEGAELMYAHAAASHADGDGHSDGGTAISLGLALLGGFAAMWLLDALAALRPPATLAGPADEPLVVLRRNGSAASLHSDAGWAARHDRGKRTDDDDDPAPYDRELESGTGAWGASSGTGSNAGTGSSRHRRALAATLALSAHSFTDGLALGAAALAPARVGLGVFAALALHRAPAAVGLAAALLRLGVARRAARAHLAAFSLAAVAGSVVGWAGLSFASGAGARGGKGVDEGAFGPVLAFSGATFL
jgi:zinc transporter 9